MHTFLSITKNLIWRPLSDKTNTMYDRAMVNLHKSFMLDMLSSPASTLSPSLSLSLRWSDHEKAVGALARCLGFTQVSLSSEVMPMVRAVPRGYTVCADAYLTPKIRQYLKGFTSGFKGGLKVCFCVFITSVCVFSRFLCWSKIPHFLWSSAESTIETLNWVAHDLIYGSTYWNQMFQ